MQSNSSRAPTLSRRMLRKVMKRIELVIEPSALDRFTECSSYEPIRLRRIEVRRFPSKDRQERQRLYRGHTFS